MSLAIRLDYKCLPDGWDRLPPKNGTAKDKMKRFQYALAFALLGYPAQAWAATAHDFFPVCAAQSPAQGQTLIVDPSGSQKNAYPTIVAAQKFAKPGDKINLMTGDYGEVTLDGRNSDFITIEAAPGQIPRFARLIVGRHGGA
ncbi:MAG: hypothetical protein P4M15_00060, partial [Alphaproteobacteria bacterium]|nr:hypothetical protein [Alphaproteobacteria bacterium]